MQRAVAPRPFSLDGAVNLPNTTVGRLLQASLERLSGLSRLDTLYRALPPAADTQAFLRQTLATLGVDYRVPQEELARIPREGPAVVVANHPFGAIEGVMLAHLLRGLRPDVKVMANYLLERIPELGGLFIGVDPFGGEAAARRNLRPLKEAMKWLDQGGLLVVFPAGAVSHLDPHSRRVTDPPWSPTIARLVRRVEAPVVPLYVDGRNGALFQAAGLLHPRLRTALLAREMLNKAGRTVTLRIGAPLPWARLKHLEDDQALIDHLRLRTYMLQDLHRRREEASRPGGRAQPAAQPLVEAVGAEWLRAEVAALPPTQRLCSGGELEVWYARAAQAPNLLREIGRLREVTFREVGEGTGKSIDLDLYDSYYLHLFVWNPRTGEVVGAYRLGPGDEILARYDRKGLYTFSLFHYGRKLLTRINPALELGRSFVRPEYQRSFSPLLLLWKGIGAFVAANPRYRILFGPVSISNEYAGLSQRLMVAFLRDNNFEPELARLVRPRRPFRDGQRQRPEYAHVKDIEALSELIAQIEGDAKGAPILLKQYLKLGGRLLGFNVDRAFSDVVDGLIMVDLTETDPKVLQRYMGKEAAEAFLAYHQALGVRRAA